MSRFSDTQILVLMLAAGAGFGWSVGQSLVYDLAPGAWRLARWTWRRWMA